MSLVHLHNRNPPFFFRRVEIANDHLASEIPKLTTLSVGCGHMAKSELAFLGMPTFSSSVSFSPHFPQISVLSEG